MADVKERDSRRRSSEAAQRIAELEEENELLVKKMRMLDFKVQLMTDMLAVERVDALAREQELLEEIEKLRRPRT